MKNGMKILMMAAMATAIALPAHAKFDDGVGKNEYQKTGPVYTTCGQSARGANAPKGKYERVMRECAAQVGTGNKAEDVTGRNKLIEGNHKLQWQQGY